MTCIIGLATDSGNWIGADSYTETGGIRSLNTSKAWRLMDGRGGYLLLGISGRAVFRPFVKNVIDIPTDKTPESYILHKLPGLLRDAAIQTNYAVLESGSASLPDNDLMIVYRGTIYYMDSYFYMREMENEYHAIGSGAAAAMGAMFAMSVGLLPKDRLQLALEAAENVNSYVSAPFQILRDRNE